VAKAKKHHLDGKSIRLIWRIFANEPNLAQDDCFVVESYWIPNAAVMGSSGGGSIYGKFKKLNFVNFLYPLISC
jgi:hypothetical protein